MSESVDETAPELLQYQRDWERRLERRIGSVTFWRIMAFTFAALCIVCLWIVGGVVAKFGFRLRWPFL